MMKDIDVHLDLLVRPPGSVRQFKADLPTQRVRSSFHHRKEDLRSRSRGWGWRQHGQSQGGDCGSGEGLATAAMSTHSQGINTEPSEEVDMIWNSAQAVCFDVDSTLCEDESIDELAAFVGAGEAVAALTASAMGGTLLFQDALKARLDIMQPSRQNVQDFLSAHPPRISPGIPELVQKLQGRGCQVFLVSGGFRAIINPIAAILGIPQDHVFANTILFKEDGSYAGFDEGELTSQSGGKARAARLIKEKHGFSRLVMVGDGATDLEARQPGGADIFIGYGGVVERPSIAAKADWYMYDIRDLIKALH